MRGLALSGDRSGAIAQFDICSDVLADELGVSPAAGDVCAVRGDP
jgi:DNA-binding SARP family transcriptional activator